MANERYIPRVVKVRQVRCQVCLNWMDAQHPAATTCSPRCRKRLERERRKRQLACVPEEVPS
jgi:predicted nucleic acid-binding Zn ribbon protein